MAYTGGMSDLILTPDMLTVETLGPARIDSTIKREMLARFVNDSERVLLDDTFDAEEGIVFQPGAVLGLERAGPREKVFFDSSKAQAGIVTCGGLCPGLNDVIRAITLALWHNYGVRHIWGFQYGYEGFVAKYGHPVIPLNPDVVDGWQDIGGTRLGSSRGPQDPADIVDCLERMAICMLFVVGGDGTLKGAMKIKEEIGRRGLKIAVVGVPKTIDNDILFIDESFGFQSAYGAAVQSLVCAHIEAKGAFNGVGLVKLMGRHSGFIACAAALAMSDVNFVLIPEVGFELDGPNGFLPALKRRLEKRNHAVVVVAEGAGQHLLESSGQQDASGNTRLGDIGLYLRDVIADYLKASLPSSSVKYIDPSYIIRSVPANASDSIYCLQLGQDAVHAAMTGRTGCIVGRWHGLGVHIPMAVVTMKRKRVDPERPLWRSVLESTGQLRWFGGA